jgi:hypothetical protein
LAANAAATAEYKCTAAFSYAAHVQPNRFESIAQSGADPTSASRPAQVFVDEVRSIVANRERFGLPKPLRSFDDEAGLQYDMPSAVLDFFGDRLRHRPPVFSATRDDPPERQELHLTRAAPESVVPDKEVQVYYSLVSISSF